MFTPLHLRFMTSTPHSRRQSAFTLIELLIVIAIIAILAAILFPVFARARENARRSSCQSNLKQVNLAAMQYSQDYDERIIPRSANWIAWPILLDPYTKNWQIFRCPSAATNELYEPGSGTPASATEKRPMSYAINSMYNQSATDLDNIFGNNNGSASLSALPVPAETVFIGDSACFPSTSATINSCFQVSGWTLFSNAVPVHWGADSGGVPTQGQFIARHLEGINVTYFDGHTKWHKLDEMLKKSNNGTNRYRYFTARED